MAAVEHLPVLYHSADYISFPLISLVPLWTFEDGVLLMYTLEGVSSVANFITAYEVSINQDSHFLICGVFFVSKGNLFDVYYTTLQLVLALCGGGRTSPRTLP